MSELNLNSDAQMEQDAGVPTSNGIEHQPAASERVGQNQDVIAQILRLHHEQTQALQKTQQQILKLVFTLAEHQPEHISETFSSIIGEVGILRETVVDF